MLGIGFVLLGNGCDIWNKQSSLFLQYLVVLKRTGY